MDAKILIHRVFGINGDDNLSRKNSENPKVGAVFQTKVAEWFRRHYSTEFVLEKKTPSEILQRITGLILLVQMKRWL